MSTTAPTHNPRLGEADPRGASLEELLIAHRAATGQLLDAHQELVKHLGRLTQPAQVETVVLGAPPQLSNVFESRERFEDPVLSIGVYNPTSIVVYFNPIGSATPNARAYPVGANNLLVLPIAANQSIEVGAAAGDVANANAVVFLLRYFTVQPAFLGKAV